MTRPRSSPMARLPMAYHARSRRQERLERLVKAFLIGVLLFAIFVAWTAVPEPELMRL